MNVADQYAGQTGPCSSCGRQISIPGSPVAFGKPAAAPSKGGGSMLLIVLGVILVGALVCCGVMAALLFPAIGSARQAAQRAQSMNNMRMIGLAMHNYHDMYGSLPPAVVKDASGAPLYSGRVLLLPFLEQAPLYERFDKTKAWNAPENSAIVSTVLPVFQDPASTNTSNSPRTDYVFVTGQGTVFEEKQDGTPMTLADVTDGLSNTVYLIESSAANAHWAEPRDMDISQLGVLPPGHHPNGNLVGILDGSVTTLSKNINPATLRGLLTRGGGEAVSY